MVALVPGTHLLGHRPWGPGWTNLSWKTRGTLKRGGCGVKGDPAHKPRSFPAYFNGIDLGLLPAPHPPCRTPPSPSLELWGHGDTQPQIPCGIHSPVVPGSQAGPGNPVEKKRAEKNPTDTPHSQTPQPDPAPCGSCWSCPPFGDTHLVPLLSSTSREAALAPGALRGDGIVGSQKFGVFSVLSGTVTAAELKLENSNWKLKFQLPNLS